MSQSGGKLIRSGSAFPIVSGIQLRVDCRHSGNYPETGSLEFSFEWLKSACPVVTRATGKKHRTGSSA